MVTPLLADTSVQARTGNGYDRGAFAFDFDTHTATYPQGNTSATWNPVVCDGKPKVVVTFASTDCLPCPARQLCTTSKAGRRQLTVPRARSTNCRPPPARRRRPRTGRPATAYAPAWGAAPTRPSTSGSAGPAIAFPRRS